jgi:hypothetical protein
MGLFWSHNSGRGFCRVTRVDWKLGFIILFYFIFGVIIIVIKLGPGVDPTKGPGLGFHGST